MTFFKPWTWLQSSERQQKLQEIRERTKLQEAFPDDDYEEDNDDDFEEEEEVSIPYKSLRLMGDTVHVVLMDGTTLSKSGVDRDFYDEVRDCDDEDEVLSLFVPTFVEEEKDKALIQTHDELELVMNNLHVLRNHPDFKIEGTNVYLKKVPLAMPASVAGSFIELLERSVLSTSEQEEQELKEKYDSLTMFWYWTALNPIESSRRDLLAFVRNNDIRITKNGLLEMYRRVVSTGSNNKSEVNFVSNSLYKVKRWYRNPQDFYVLYMQDGTLGLGNVESTHNREVKHATRLDVAYSNLPQLKENSFTDGHTRTMSIKVGEVYSISEDKIDLNNLQSCSAGLHVGSRSFMFGGFGDVGVLALVNPSKVRAVPVHDGNKMRVSEMFIAAVVDLDEYSKSVDEKDLADYSNEYFAKSVEELEADIRTRNLDGFSCQGKSVGLTIASMDEIRRALQDRVEEFA